MIYRSVKRGDLCAPPSLPPSLPLNLYLPPFVSRLYLRYVIGLHTMPQRLVSVCQCGMIQFCLNINMQIIRLGLLVCDATILYLRNHLQHNIEARRPRTSGGGGVMFYDVINGGSLR